MSNQEELLQWGIVNEWTALGEGDSLTGMSEVARVPRLVRSEYEQGPLARAGLHFGFDGHSTWIKPMATREATSITDVKAFTERQMILISELFA